MPRLPGLGDDLLNTFLKLAPLVQEGIGSELLGEGLQLVGTWPAPENADGLQCGFNPGLDARALNLWRGRINRLWANNNRSGHLGWKDRSLCHRRPAFPIAFQT